MPRTPQPDPISRLRRGLEIRAARAAGESWTAIGRRYGISDRQARRSAKAAAETIEVVGTFDQHDARALMARILAVQVTALDRLEALLAGEPGENAVIGGVRAISTLGDSSWQMLTRLGVLPDTGARVRLEAETRMLAEALLRAADDAGIDRGAVKQRLIEDPSLSLVLEGAF